jgi:hypothetical protein
MPAMRKGIDVSVHLLECNQVLSREHTSPTTKATPCPPKTYQAYAHLVVHQHGAQEQAKAEDLGGVVLGLVEGIRAFAVQQHLAVSEEAPQDSKAPPIHV